MTLALANQAFDYYKAQREVLEDPSLTPFGKARMTMALQDAAKVPEPQQSFTGWDLVKGAIGAGLGAGAGTLAAKFFGLSDPLKSQMQGLGMGMGTLMNMGLVKKAHERDTRYAFRLGFIKAAAEAGVLKTAVQLMPLPTLPLTPDTFAAPVRGAFNIFNKGVQGTGTALGALDSASDTDVEVAKMEAEMEQLAQKEEELKARRANRLVDAILRKRSA